MKYIARGIVANAINELWTLKYLSWDTGYWVWTRFYQDMSRPPCWPSGRLMHTMTKIGNSRMLIWGGAMIGLNDTAVWVLEVEDDSSGAHVPFWTKPIVRGTPPQLRSGHTMVAYNDTALILFGGTHVKLLPSGDYSAKDFFNDAWLLQMPRPAACRRSPMSIQYAARCATINVSSGLCTPKYGCNLTVLTNGSARCTDGCVNNPGCMAPACEAVPGTVIWEWRQLIPATAIRPGVLSWHSGLTQRVESNALTVYGGAGYFEGKVITYSQVWELRNLTVMWAMANRSSEHANVTNHTSVTNHTPVLQQVVQGTWLKWSPESDYPAQPLPRVFHSAVRYRSAMIVWGGLSCDYCKSMKYLTAVWCLDVILPPPLAFKATLAIERINASGGSEMVGNSAAVWMLRLSWSKPMVPKGALSGYHIYMCDSTQNGTTSAPCPLWQRVEGDTDTLHVEAREGEKPLQFGNAYAFQIAAVATCRAGEATAMSQRVHLIPDGPPPSPPDSNANFWTVVLAVIAGACGLGGILGCAANHLRCMRKRNDDFVKIQDMTSEGREKLMSDHNSGGRERGLSRSSRENLSEEDLEHRMRTSRQTFTEGSTEYPTLISAGKRTPPIRPSTPRSSKGSDSNLLDKLNLGRGWGGENDGIQVDDLPELLKPGGLLAIEPSDVEIGQRFAAGGSGQCLYGRFADTDVVLKELYTQIVSNDFHEFLNEATLLARLNHPGIVRFYGTVFSQVGQHGGLYLVTELCRNGSLAALIDRNALTHNLWAKYARQLSETMRFLHKRSIVHRDIKPENCLVGNDGSLKVCDLGLARVQVGDQNSLTCEGTFAYMPPEVMSTEKLLAYDAKKWDVYSTGVLFLAMWTCQHPYHDLTPPQIIAGVANSQGLRPSIPEDCPAQVRMLVEAMWTEAPEDRPSFDEVVPRLAGAEFDALCENAAEQPKLTTKEMLRKAKFGSV